MGKKYAEPPVIEAVCEFKLPADSEWDLTIPGLIYERVSAEFPHKEQHLVQEVNMKQSSEGTQHQIHTSERAVFLSDDRKAFLQMGPHLLAVNCLKPYPSWVGFKPRIENAFRALTNTVRFETLQRIGLRYINRIEIPSQSLDLDEYFEFRPFLGENLPQDMANFIVGCMLPFNERRDCCKVQLTNVVPEEPGDTAFLLDLDYFLVRPQAIPVNGALEWVEQAHEQVETLFEGCISARLRERFEEVK